jgi:hypothetical protein
MPMTLVSTVTVGSGGASSIQFTNIAQTGKDLLVVWSVRLGTTIDSLFIRVAGSSSGYTNRTLYGQGSAALSISSGTTGFLAFNQAQGTDTTSSTFGNGQLYLSDYTSTSNKSASIDSVTENNATTAFQVIAAGSFTSSAALTELSLEPSSTPFAQHSTASLYIIS